MALTDQQLRFAKEYVVDLNATQAAIRAGYSANSAKQQGSRLLTNDDVVEAIQEANGAILEKTGVTAEYVIDGLRTVAERCLERAPVMVGQGESRTQAKDDDGNHVWEFNAAGANKAFELLGKHLTLFTEKHEVQHSLDPEMAKWLGR